MESNINKSFELSEEDNITWKEVYDKIPRLLKMIEQIFVEKLENKGENVKILEFLKDLDLGIKEDEPYIMHESDFDNINFYKYILRTAIYYLKQNNINTIINELNPPVFKHLIDLCAIIQRIIKEEKNYEKRDVKYYIYHIVNAFADIDNKLESDFKFLKCGIELLLKTYNIKDYDEYFSNEDKAEIRRNFCFAMKKLLSDIRVYMDNNKYSEDEDDNKKKIFEKVIDLCGKARMLNDDEADIQFLGKVNSFLNELYNILRDDSPLECICDFIKNFKKEIPKSINNFYYSIFCFVDKKLLKKKEEKLDEQTYIDDFKNNCICDSSTKNSFMEYFCQFIKRKNMFNKLISGKNSNKIYFEELLSDTKFRDKIINFYSSQKIKDFIKERCNNKEKDKLMKKLPYLIELMKKDNFWKRIMLFPMSKNKMASVENYLRIVINTEHVKYHNIEGDMKKTISNLLLFELLIHEIFNFLRRLIFLGKKAKDAITPLCSYDKNTKVNNKDKSTFQNNNIEKEVNEKKPVNEEKQYGEIGQRLIRYIFNVDKIVSISYVAGVAFKELTLKDENEIKELPAIISKEDISCAKFTSTKKDGIEHKIHDCRDYYCSKCDKFICNDCKFKLDLEKEEYILIPINKIDCYCLEHNDPYVVYCNICNKSSCNYCKNEPSNHNVELIQRMKIEINEIERLENKIKILKYF